MKQSMRRQESLLQAELESLCLEDSFMHDEFFIDTFTSGDVKDVITLNNAIW